MYILYIDANEWVGVTANYIEYSFAIFFLPLSSILYIYIHNFFSLLFFTFWCVSLLLLFSPVFIIIFYSMLCPFFLSFSLLMTLQSNYYELDYEFNNNMRKKLCSFSLLYLIAFFFSFIVARIHSHKNIIYVHEAYSL